MNRDEYLVIGCDLANHKRHVVKCDKLSMRVVEMFESARDAEKKYGFHKNTVANICMKKTVSKGRFVWRFADEHDINETFEGKTYRPVEVLDGQTGERMYFESTQATAKAFGVPPIAVTQTLARDGKFLNRYALRYAR